MHTRNTRCCSRLSSLASSQSLAALCVDCPLTMSTDLSSSLRCHTSYSSQGLCRLSSEHVHSFSPSSFAYPILRPLAAHLTIFTILGIYPRSQAPILRLLAWIPVCHILTLHLKLVKNPRQPAYSTFVLTLIMCNPSLSFNFLCHLHICVDCPRTMSTFARFHHSPINTMFTSESALTVFGPCPRIRL